MVLENLQLNGVHLCYKNFSGAIRGEYDKLGDRKFSIILDEQTATELQNRGWPVSIKPDKDGNGMWCTLPVHLGNYEPPVYEKSNIAMAKLTGDDLNQLDKCMIEDADVYLRLATWKKGKRSGNSAYVNSMVVRKKMTDPFYSEYMDMNQQKEAQNPPEPDESDLP